MKSQKSWFLVLTWSVPLVPFRDLTIRTDSRTKECAFSPTLFGMFFSLNYHRPFFQILSNDLSTDSPFFTCNSRPCMSDQLPQLLVVAIVLWLLRSNKPPLVLLVGQSSSRSTHIYYGAWLWHLREFRVFTGSTCPDLSCDSMLTLPSHYIFSILQSSPLTRWWSYRLGSI